MGRWDIAPVQIMIKPHEYRTARVNQVDYYYVAPGFFDLRHNSTMFFFTGLNVLTVIGLYQLCVHQLWPLLFVNCLFALIATLGLTAGSHRLWAHRAFEAKWPLRLFLILAQASAGVWSIRTWFINHTVHHKWSDTDADPHNASRGLFFAHGFFMFKLQHPLNAIKRATIDPSPVMKDPLVKFQFENFEVLFVIFGMIVPTICGLIVTGEWSRENWINALLICYAVKHFFVTHLSGLLNSAAHVFGDQPYMSRDKTSAGENRILSWFSVGEGYHNYHHAFPQDYATGEFGQFSLLTGFIDLMAFCGQAYNLKRSSPNVIESTKHNTTNTNKRG